MINLASFYIVHSTTSLQEFLKDFIEKIYLGHVHFAVSNNINLATKGELLVTVFTHTLLYIDAMNSIETEDLVRRNIWL